MNYAGLKDQIDRIFKGAVADANAVLDDQGLAKAADAMAASDMVNDQFQSGQKHLAATAEEVNVGPRQRATGGNTEKMNGEYSSNAPQMGTNADAMKLMSNLSVLEATMKAHAEALGHQGAAITALIDVSKSMQTALAAFVTAKAEDEKKDDKDEYSEKAKARATVLISEATTLVAKAKSLRKAAEEMDDDDEKAAAKAARTSARKARKDAATALMKARRLAYVAGDAELKKSVLAVAAKADIDMEEDDLEKSMDDEAACDKSVDDAGAAAKANQADKQDSTTGNQAAATAKADAPDMAKAVAAALAGVATMQTTINGLVDMVSGMTPVRVAEVAKSATNVAEPDSTIYDRIEEARDNDLLTGAEAIRATSMAQAYEAVVKGTADKAQWLARLEKEPAAVRGIYAKLAA